MVDLTPWPAATAIVARAAAIARLSSEVQGRTLNQDLTVNTEATNHLGLVASALVENYAANAPQALKDEASIRFCGALAQSDYGTILKEDIGPRSVEYVTNHASMFRNSGAAMLLTRWKKRRGGAI